MISEGFRRSQGFLTQLRSYTTLGQESSVRQCDAACEIVTLTDETFTLFSTTLIQWNLDWEETVIILKY